MTITKMVDGGFRQKPTVLKRVRVCYDCYDEYQDERIGKIHSEDECERCGDKPCEGYVIQVVR